MGIQAKAESYIRNFKILRVEKEGSFYKVGIVIPPRDICKQKLSPLSKIPSVSATKFPILSIAAVFISWKCSVRKLRKFPSTPCDSGYTCYKMINSVVLGTSTSIE